jgi:hypothetical protein
MVSTEGTLNTTVAPSASKPEQPAASAVAGPSAQAAVIPKLAVAKKAKPADPNVKYEVVTVQLPDGTLKKFKRPAKPKAAEGDAAAASAPRAATAPKASVATTGTTDAKPSASATTTKAETPSDEQDKTKAVSSIASDAKAAAGNGPPKSGSTKDNAGKAGPAAATAPSTTADTATPASPSSTTADKAAALAEQDLYFKQRRRQAFKRALLGGAARVLATDLVDAADIVIEDDLMSDFDSDVDDSDLDADGGNNPHDPEDNDHDQQEHDGDGAPHPLQESEIQQHSDLGSSHHGNEPDSLGSGRAGAVVGDAAAAAVSAPPKQPTVTIDEKKIDGKETYKFTQKDLNALDAAAAAKAKEAPLKHRWSAIGFYFMASLSVILPLLFVLLCTFILVMDGKPLSSPTANDAWNMQGTAWLKMPDAIKVGITAWPIVFAAVVAQAFKTWATYRVERGVTLGELEQLVGANSFAAAAKQPFLLRRLDLITLFVFLSWCLSPIGSQALQRVYVVERSVTTVDSTVHYQRNLGKNRLFSPGAREALGDQRYGQLLQTTATYYIASFIPPAADQGKPGPTQNYLSEDQYRHPVLKQTNLDMQVNTALYGTPVGLPEIASWAYLAYEPPGVTVSADSSPSENATFTISTSYFGVQCGSWREETYDTLDQLFPMSTSPSLTFGINFTDTVVNGSVNLPPVTRIGYATLANLSDVQKSQVDANGKTNYVSPPGYSPYLYIECDMQQVFIEADIYCGVDLGTADPTHPPSGIVVSSPVAWRCFQYGTARNISDVDPSWHTPLIDFLDDFVPATNPDSIYSPTTSSRSTFSQMNRE